jgi:HEAT repeat protein
MRPPAADDLFGWVDRLAVPHHQKEAMWHLILSGPDALPAVRAGLAHDDPVIRRGCTQVLDHLVDDDALADLVEMVNDEDPEVRVWALHALACERCKENGCTPSMADVLPAALDRLRNDASYHVRAHALGVVANYVHLDDSALAAVIEAHTRDANAGVRKKAGWFVPGGVRYEKTKPKVRRARSLSRGGPPPPAGRPR